MRKVDIFCGDMFVKSFYGKLFHIELEGKKVSRSNKDCVVSVVCRGSIIRLYENGVEILNPLNRKTD